MDERQRFEQLATAYFKAVYRSAPTLATDLGIHTYDHLLDDLSQSAIQARIRELKAFRRKFRALDATQLQNGADADYALIVSDIENELWLLADTRDWETDPSYYVSDAFFSIFLLAARDFAPRAERINNLAARLEQVPALLDAARANLKNPPYILTEIGIEETEGAIEFCALLGPEIAAQMKPPRRFTRAVKQALGALREFLKYLQDDLTLTSTGKLGVGAKHYAKILRYDHMLPYTIEEVVMMGERVFAETEREMAAWAKRIDKSKTWREITAQARAEFPARNGLLGAYRREVARLRDFVRERDLVTLPEQDCEVIATPPFERALNSFAAYIAPGPFEQDQRGQFWVTPVDARAPRAQQIEQLEEHCNYLYPVTAAHEAYPGHHVQLARANQVGSRWRKHFSSSIFAEGWALYCEELMNQAGYYQDPRVRLFQLKDRLWRAARVINEIGIHCYGLPMDDAARFLVDKAGLSRSAARAETRRYVAEPGQPMSYLIGELEVERLRKKFRRLPLKKFHDLLLDSGTVPFVLVEKEMEEKVAGSR
ncbi:MAG: hypothetical protein B6D41_20050 [Chloroflexi bacterium UTCFX4]|jgi:uncharacterized protein (DUF885 family)|nr:MAG: hypothetical protein B6D41_20050 [Chloroflexi bacterium UTCFX4]